MQHKIPVLYTEPNKMHVQSQRLQCLGRERNYLHIHQASQVRAPYDCYLLSLQTAARHPVAIGKTQLHNGNSVL